MTAPTNFFLCGRNLADEATLTATVTPVATLPLSNLQRTSRARVWRSSTAAAVDIVASLANTTSERINFVFLGRHNLESAATWRVQLYTSTDGSGAASYDSGTVAAYDASTLGDLDWGVDPLGSGIFDGFLGQRFSVAYFAQNTATVINSVRVTITDTGNSAGYVEASRLYFGRGIELTYQPNSLSLSWDEDTKQERSDGGTLMSDGSLAFREMSVDLEWVTEAQRAEILDISRYAGMRKDIFASAYPGVGGESERDHTGIWRLTRKPDLSTVVATDGPSNTTVQTWKSKFEFAEI